jgi:hypothetical protein
MAAMFRAKVLRTDPWLCRLRSRKPTMVAAVAPPIILIGNHRHQILDLVEATRCDDAERGQVAPHCIDKHRSLPDQKIADAVRDERRLLQSMDVRLTRFVAILMTLNLNLLWPYLRASHLRMNPIELPYRSILRENRTNWRSSAFD